MPPLTNDNRQLKEVGISQLLGSSGTIVADGICSTSREKLKVGK